MKSMLKIAIVAIAAMHASLMVKAQPPYIINQTDSVQNAFFWISGRGKMNNGLIIAKDGADVQLTGVRLLNAAETRGANFQLTGGTAPGLATWVHDGTNWIERMRVLLNGYVGIDTIAPTTKLAVWDTSTVAYTPTGNTSAIPPEVLGRYIISM